MTRFSTHTAAAALLLALAQPAAAQVAGVYTGTAADGSGVTFTVGTDPNTGALAVISVGIGFSAPCKNNTFVLQTGWGYNPNADISNGKVSWNYDFNYLSSAISLNFAGNGQSATGTITSISPTLYTVGPKPKKALFCSSPKQSLTVTLQTTAKAAPPVPRAVIY